MRILLAAAMLLAAGTGAASAQVVTRPDMNDTPLGQNVSGFLAVSLGLAYMPAFGAEAEPADDNFAYKIKNDRFVFPGFAAHVSMIPAWGNNALMVEAGYDVLAMEWKQEVDDSVDHYSGKSTLALNALSISTNYVRYFLSGADRLYALAGAGYVWESAKLATETGDDSNTDNASFPNWRLNAGLGYLHQMSTGAIGVELRADYLLNDSSFDLEDPYGKYEVTMTHPVILRLGATFAIGRLLER